MNIYQITRRGMGRGIGRGRGFCYLDETRLEDLVNYDFLLNRGMRQRDNLGRASRLQRRSLKLREGYHTYPDSICRGVANRRAIMEQLDKESKKEGR